MTNVVWVEALPPMVMLPKGLMIKISLSQVMSSKVSFMGKKLDNKMGYLQNLLVPRFNIRRT